MKVITLAPVDKDKQVWERDNTKQVEYKIPGLSEVEDLQFYFVDRLKDTNKSLRQLQYESKKESHRATIS